MSTFQLDFVGVGVGKAGTSWVAQCLDEHPQICIAFRKETNYFTIHHVSRNMPVTGTYYASSHHDRGIEWLKSRFKHHQPGQLRGEFSPSYLGDPETPALLHEHNPDMKLIFNYRNPPDALYAGFYQLSQVQPFRFGFEGFVDRYPELIDYFMLHRNTLRYLERFSRDQMFFIVFDDIKTDAGAVFKNVCRFLNVDPDFVPPSLHERVNPRKVVRSRFVRDVMCTVSGLLNKSPEGKRVRRGLCRLGLGGMKANLRRLNEKPGRSEPMKPETRRHLVEVFGEENLRLGEFLGRDLSHWNRLDAHEAGTAADASASGVGTNATG
jgi:hypothetical protein